MAEAADTSSASLADVLVEQETAWQRLISAIDKAPAGRVEEPGISGDWSLKTLIGHIGYWDRFEANRFANEPDLGDVDWERLNQENAAQTSGRRYDELYQEMLDSHHLLKWAVDRARGVSPKRLRELSTEHYVEHAAEIEAWLECRG